LHHLRLTAMKHTYTILAIARRHPALFAWLLTRKV
jgi:hypothetical protein